jgi:type IV pilus assembly protein PilW
MKSQRGFTLIELMIASLIGIIIMGGLMNLFIVTNRSVALSDSLSKNQETGRFAMEYLTRFIRQSGYTENFTTQLPFLFVPYGQAGENNFIGCDTTPESLACSANNPADARGDRLSIPFTVAPGNIVRSCSGTNLPANAPLKYYVNVIWISNTAPHDRELRCRTYDTSINNWVEDSAVTVINNVELLEFQVGVALNMTNKDVGRYVSVDTLIDQNLLPMIRSIRISLLTTSFDENLTDKVNTTKKERTYSLLDAPHLTITDGNLRNIFSNTIPLINAIESAADNN